MVKHNRLYNIFLVLLGIYVFLGIGLLIPLLRTPIEARPRMLVPHWSLSLLALINGLLLAAPPFGTALGVYGLWKVDREQQASIAGS